MHLSTRNISSWFRCVARQAIDTASPTASAATAVAVASRHARALGTIHSAAACAVAVLSVRKPRATPRFAVVCTAPLSAVTTTAAAAATHRRQPLRRRLTLNGGSDQCTGCVRSKSLVRSSDDVAAASVADALSSAPGSPATDLSISRQQRSLLRATSSDMLLSESEYTAERSVAVQPPLSLPARGTARSPATLSIQPRPGINEPGAPVGALLCAGRRRDSEAYIFYLLDR